MRLWAASRDSDSNFKVDENDFQKHNRDLKLIRQLMKHMLGSLHHYNYNEHSN
jgi:isoleucyl-tRNA synthetase